jgi:hypothetical protein
LHELFFSNLKQDGGNSSSEVAPTLPLLDYDYDKDHMAAHMEYGPMDEQLPLLKPRTHTR